MRPVYLTVCAAILAATAGCSLLLVPAQTRPDWVDHSETSGNSTKFISAVGTAEAGLEGSVMLQMADEEARLKLADAVADYVKSVIEEFLETHKGYADPASGPARGFTEVVSRGTSNAVLRQSLRGDSWRDPKSGALHIRYRVPISAANAKMREDARFALRQVNPFARSLEQEAMEELAQFLNAKLRERVAMVPHAHDPEVDVSVGSSPPEWLALGRHEDYTHDRFMIAVGIAHEQEDAEESTRSEFADRVARRAADFTVEGLLDIEVVEGWYEPVTNTH